MSIKRDDLEDLYPLTPMQEGMLFHARQSPESVAYIEQVVWRVTGPFSTDAYRSAWLDVQARYAPLRSVFTHERSKEPLQAILKTRPLDWAVLPAASDAATDADARTKAVAEAERGTPFDLANGPLFRVRVLAHASEQHDVVLTWHHIVLDGWSTHAMLRDLRALYHARVTGEPAMLTPLPSYRPYVQWLSSRDRAGSLAYWRRVLDGETTPAELPRLRARAGQTIGAESAGRVASYSLDHVRVPLLSAVATAIPDVAAALNATPNVLLQTLWGVFLGRYLDSEDVVFGAVVSGRPPEVPGIEDMAGLLINTVPVRVAWTGEDTVAALVARVQQQWLDGQPHQASKLADVQQQSPLGAATIKSLFVFENYPTAPAADTAGASIDVLASSEPTNYDLALVMGGASPITIECQFNAAVYARVFVERAMQHFAALVTAAVRYPQARLGADAADGGTGALDLLDASQRQHVAVTLNDTARAYPRERSVIELWRETVAAHGSDIAVVEADRSFTYAELDRRSNQLARHLAAHGVTSGGRVAVALDRSLANVEALLAVLKCGAAYVPIDPSTPAERIAFIVADAGVQMLVAQTTDDAKATGVPSVLLDVTSGAIDASADAPMDPPRTTPTDPAALFYTSGSSGQPKAVVVPHRAIVRLVRGADYVSLGPDTRMAHVSNVAFDASTFEIWGALLNGGQLHLIHKDTALAPSALARDLKSRRITTLFLTTALFNQVARETPDAFAPLESVLFGGEQVEPRWVKRVLQRGAPARLVHVYGPTETCTFATAHVVTSVADAATIPIGRPIANTTCYVVDRHNRLQPIGAMGELLIGGDAVALGYHARPALTSAAFTNDPFGDDRGRVYRTGDIVRRNLDDDLEFIGRRDAQVKLRGFRIELGEVELAIRDCAEVTNALAVVHQEEASGDRRLVAYVEAAHGDPGAVERAVRAHLSARLPAYMIPSLLIVVEAFPLTPNGKVDRRALPAPTKSGMGFSRTYVEPATDTERRVAAVWQQVLGAARVGRTDNFFELGGHSLTATSAIAHMRASLQVDVPIATFFAAPTLDAVSAVVDQLRAAGPAAPSITRVARAPRRQTDPESA